MSNKPKHFKTISLFIACLILIQPLSRIILPSLFRAISNIGNYEYIEESEIPASLLCPYISEENKPSYLKYYYKNIYGCRVTHEYDNVEIALTSYTADNRDIPTDQEDTENNGRRTMNNLTARNEREFTKSINDITINFYTYEEITEYGSISSFRVDGSFYYKDTFHKIEMAVLSPEDTTMDDAIEEISMILENYLK